MSEYLVKVTFWLRAFDSLTIEADTDAEAIEMAEGAAKSIMECAAFPEHIDTDARRQGIIAYIDRLSPVGRTQVAEDVAFEDDRVSDALTL